MATASGDDGARIWGLNFRLSTDVLAEATSGIEALGIEAKEFFVLDGIEDLSYPGEIAKRLSMSRPTMTLHLRNLEKKGLVLREMDQGDLRRHRLALTLQGSEVARKARELVSGAYSHRLNRLDVSERERFGELLAKLTG